MMKIINVASGIMAFVDVVMLIAQRNGWIDTKAPIDDRQLADIIMNRYPELQGADLIKQNREYQEELVQLRFRLAASEKERECLKQEIISLKASVVDLKNQMTTMINLLNESCLRNAPSVPKVNLTESKLLEPLRAEV